MWENINEIRERMKRSDSELAFEEFVRYWKTMSTNTAFSTSNPDAANNIVEVVDSNDSTPLPTHLISGFKLRRHYQEDGTYSSYDTEAAASETDDVLLLSQNLTPNSSTQLDCQSSICTGGNLSSGSPLSAGNKPKRRVATSASSDHDPTDDDEEGDDDDEEVETEAGQCEQSFGEVETEAGQCEQSYDPPTVKLMRRKISNRESARRSRKRKQEQLADLELQAEQLMGENDSLYKQLTNAHHQFRDADTNNRVLKSDVEALRAKVKLAEDMIARGSLTSGLNQLLQNHLISAQPMASHNLRRVANVSPTITVPADDSSFSGLTFSGNSGPHPLSNIDISSGNLNTRMGADDLSCVTDIWR